ncbi:MGH1-like glycoside hydrolase domain-containing protein [Endozoicomonas arenosclerae]|uniref:MGH1-like glycoside hydrolase domain-containing protein n=1 Tax=Endozoicomonas arenosclerae TaxID=1633495 RepID=UPI000A735FB7|nr:trehalase family glycosidase [Endozoicomonas arenosclerae]
MRYPVALALFFLCVATLCQAYWIGDSHLYRMAGESEGQYFDKQTYAFPLSRPWRYSEANLQQLLPEVLIEDTHINTLNKIAWITFFNNIRWPEDQRNNRYVSDWLSTQFSNHEFFWDQAFCTFGFGLYAHRYFPITGGLDNFYRFQHPNGFIPRETSPYGYEIHYVPSQPTSLIKTENETDEALNRVREKKIRELYIEENKNNPPLVAHAEWRYYLLSRDAQRLHRVVLPLEHYTQWQENNRQVKAGPLKGLFWQRAFGSGMDNIPLGFDTWSKDEQKISGHSSPEAINVIDLLDKNDAWLDISAQMKLHYDAMANIERVLGNNEQSEAYKAKSSELKDKINECMWDSHNGGYFNVRGTCENKETTFTLSMFWTLYAEVASQSQVDAMLPMLSSSLYFKSEMPYPSLAQIYWPILKWLRLLRYQFNEDGNYWQGGSWPPLVYITLKGLMNYAADKHNAWLEYTASTEKYLEKLANNLIQASNESETTEPETLKEQFYEYNSPTNGGPGKRNDEKKTPAKSNFLGWAGLGPIGLVQESLIGINVHETSITWHLHRYDTHGIRNLHIGSGVIHLEVSPGQPLHESDFTLSAKGLVDQGIESLIVYYREEEVMKRLTFNMSDLEQCR